MKKFMIVLNAVRYNRGSEALARSIAQICRKKYPDCDITLISSEVGFSEYPLIDGINHNVRRYDYVSKYSFVNLLAVFQRFVLKDVAKATYTRCRTVIKKAKEMDCVVVVGGDNYDKSYHLFYILHSLNLALSKAKVKKMVLYDCSLEEKDIDGEIVQDMKLFDGVSARESLTYENFQKVLPKGLSYYPDPAFIMSKKQVDLPKEWVQGHMVGVNVSNLVASGQYGVTEEEILSAYYKMVTYILENTDNHIVLIPHVMDGADLSVLRKIYDKFKDTKKIILIENEKLTAPELKYLISNCRFLVTARTHASIAAYSTGVPTLVLGYSIKSVGIATDLFGRSEDYVVPSNTLKNSDILAQKFKWLEENETQIRKRLEEVMPEYLQKTWDSIKLFE